MLVAEPIRIKNPFCNFSAVTGVLSHPLPRYGAVPGHCTAACLEYERFLIFSQSLGDHPARYGALIRFATMPS